MRCSNRCPGEDRSALFGLAALRVLLVVLIASLVSGTCTSTLAADEAPLSPRNASYSIGVRLDPTQRTLEGKQVLTWRNIQDQPTSELFFHLYWNGWRNDRSTWLSEDAIRERSDIESPRDEDWGFLVVDAIRLLADGGEGPRETPSPATAAESEAGESAPAETPLANRFVAPDDDNAFDRTVMVVDLPRPVEPGETIRVELDWHARVPRTFARTGARGEFFFIAHWFPKLGVFEGDGWNCHQYHAATEFFSDYGVYDVRIRLPSRYVIGATGRLTAQESHDDGTTTHRFEQADVHAFTWTASPDYRERKDRFDEPGLPPVDIRLLYQPEHEGQVERHIDATKAALEYYGSWFGPYPYGHVTVVDPAWRGGAGGMEYPTIFTCGSGLFRPFGGGSPEGVTIHEAGHQFWYGLVGNNEFEHAWLDEGLNTFATGRTLDAAYGETYYTRSYLDPPGEDFGGFVRVLFDDVPMGSFIGRWRRFVAGRADRTGPMSIPTYLAHPGEVGNLSYAKTALWLLTLERHLGWETLQRIMSTFFERFRFRHPRPEDFFAVASEVAGEDLGWFFDQVWASEVDFDYAIASVSSEPARIEGYAESDGEEISLQSYEDGDPESYRSLVLVRRLGGGVFPLQILMSFEGGSQLRRTWDGHERWKVFAEEGPSKLEYAVIDPARVLMLDIDYSNNGRRLESRAAWPARKWASKWMVYLQDLLITYSFFI